MICLACLSCNQSNQFADKAKETANNSIKELAVDPNSVNITDLNAVYSDDSLCIIHFNLTAKNKLGLETTSKMEYIYLSSNSQVYESFHALTADSIYQNNNYFDKNKKGEIYENLPYEKAMYYRAALFTNKNGRVVGDKEKEKEVKIPLPTGTGFWELMTYEDKYGDKTGEKYLVLIGSGTFSNSATTGSKLTALLFVDKNYFSIRIVEYGYHIVKDDDLCSMDIKDSYGTEYSNWQIQNSKSGDLVISNQSWQLEKYNQLKEMLQKEGEISISATMGKYTTSKYKFKFDVTGYNKAVKYIK